MFGIQEEFNKAREFIKQEYGLELTLIELVRLRNDYVKPAVEMMNSFDFTRSDCGYDPDIESATNFLADYYGIPAYDIFWVNSQYILGAFPKIREYLKIVQERAHKP
jgi:hypothetical protein